MHRLLKRQIKKALSGDPSDDLAAFLELVSAAYERFDDDRDMLDRSLDLSSRELIQRNSEILAMFHAFPDTFIWVDAKGLVIDIKGGMQDDLIVSTADYLGKTILELPHFGNIDKISQALGQMQRERRLIHYEYSLKINSDVRHYEARLQPLVGSSILVIVRNITARKKAEEALYAAHHRLEDIFDYLTDAIFAIDENKTVIAWNKAAEKMTGVSKEEMLGRGNYEYAIPFYGERRPILIDLVQDVDPKHEATYDFINRVGDTLFTEVSIKPTGGFKGAYVWATASPLYDRDGHMAGAIESVRDISSRKHAMIALEHAEQQYQDIFENAVEGIFQSTPGGHYLRANPAMANILGYDSTEDLLLNVTDIATQVYVDPNARADMLKILDTNQEARGFETRMYRKDKKIVWTSLSVKAVCSDEGDPLYYEGFLQDISDRRHTSTVSEILFRTSAAVASTRNLDELYLAIHETLIELIGAANFFIALVDTNRDRIHFPYFSDVKDDYLDILNISDPEVSSPTIQIIRERSPLQIMPSQTVSEQGFIGTKPQVWIGVPLSVNNETIGAMVIQDYDDPDHFPDDTMSILAAVSDHVALAIERKMAHDALRESEEKYRSIFENSIEGIFQSTKDGTLLVANPAMARIFGFDSAAELITNGGDLRALYKNPEDRNRYVQQIIKKGSVKDFEFECLRPDGTSSWVTLTAHCVYGKNGKVKFFEGNIEDINSKKQAQAALGKQKALFRQLFENSPQAIAYMDTTGRIETINAAFEQLFGCTLNEAKTKNLLVVPKNKHDEAKQLQSVIMSGTSVSKETVRQHKDGHEIAVSILGYPFIFADKQAGSFFIYNDISQRKEYEKQLTHQALHDPLTGLANRTLFLERLEQAMQRSIRRKDYSFAVLLIDLDRFKRVNDSLGHQAGDKLLIEVGRRINSCIRSMDTLARLGGDEFAILLEEFSSLREAIQITKRTQERICEPFIVNGSKVYPSASTGIVLKTDIYQAPEEILRDADISMYRAKEQGKNRFRVFNTTMHEKAIHAVQMEAEIRRGIPRNEFFYEYQPILLAKDLSIAGFEALSRWNHPKRGLVSPGEFVPVAEESGLIVSLGRAVLENACRTAASWKPASGLDNFTLAVNLSQRQLSQVNLVDEITEILKTTGFPPQRLKLEITETTIMKNAESALIKLKKLKDLGVAISVDDFGTGYSSLSYLHRFPVDMLKVDRSFVFTMFDKPENEEIVKTIIVLGHTLGLEIVAEGVETKQQLTALQDLGCDYLQGFYFSKPVAENKAEMMLKGK